MQLSPNFQRESPIFLSNGLNSAYRSDLTPAVRAKIAFIAEFGKNFGRISRLSNRFNISRTTVYSFRDRLRGCISEAFNPIRSLAHNEQQIREQTIRQILLLRLSGQCKLSAISNLLSCNGFKRDSIGFISQTLNAIGDKLPQVIDYSGTVNWACDEIFHLGTVPILVTVEPISGAVLQIQIAQKSLIEAWVEHWQALETQGIHPQCLISDEGVMLRAARMRQADWDFQPDTFHAVSHRLGVFEHRFVNAAYVAIGAEYEREAQCLNAKWPKQLPQYEQQLIKRQQETQKALNMQSNFSFLYRCLVEQFNIFDRNGLPRKRAFAEAEAQCAIELMRSLEIPALDKELTLIDKLLPDLFNFLDKAANTCRKICDSKQFDEQLFPFWCMAWQYHKRALKVKNNYAYQKKCCEKSKLLLVDLEQASNLDCEGFNKLKASIFALCDSIIQSSAPVEMFNSILRPFLNQARDQISQQTLNLIMDFYNHRIFKRGKRKGKSPYQILTGKKPEQEWLDKMIDLVRLNNI